MAKHFILFALIVLSFQVFAGRKKHSRASTLQGVVQSCHDGDTCRVVVDGQVLKIRFSGIDTPELHQKYGPEAKQFTETLVKGKAVDLKCEGRSYDRLTCDLYIHLVHVNAELVRNGWAYDSTKYSKGKYKDMVAEAQKLKLGMWKHGSPPMSPYCFRHKTAKACKRNIAYMP